jgi:glycosyltransferase involved in cell wall biosynthesis
MSQVAFHHSRDYTTTHTRVKNMPDRLPNTAVWGILAAMRIGLLTDCYKPGVNGIIRFITMHKRMLEEMGHQVFVLTWGPSHPDDEPGVIRSWGPPFARPGYHLGFGYSRRAEAILQTLDVLHANQPLMSGGMATHYGRRYGIPVVLTCHSRYDLLWETALPILPLSFYRAALRPPMRRITDRCDLVIATTSEAAKVMHDIGVARPIEVIPLGVELAHYRQSRHRLTRDDVGVPEFAPLALYLGRLSPEKNVHFLLEALARPELAHMHLLLVGDGFERRELESCARELGLDGRAHFAGEVPAADIPAYAALADLFVIASQIEMLPIAVLEALAAGLPVVGLDVPWIRPTVEHGTNGLLAQPDVASFAQTWASLAENEPLRARLAAGARAASERYDVRHTTALLVAHYERLVVERRDRRGAGACCG